MGKVSISEIAKILKENNVKIDEKKKKIVIEVLNELENYLKTSSINVENEILKMEELLGRKLSEKEINHIKRKLGAENTINIPNEYKRSFAFAKNNVLFVKRLISML